MIRLELVRIIADWLLHATKGVNAYIPSVPRDAGDAAPPLIAAWVDPVHAQVTQFAVFDESRHDWAANRMVEPPAMPSLSVIVQGRVLMGEAIPSGQYRETSSPAQVAIRYLTANASTSQAVQDGDYVLRAVGRSLRELTLNANEANRKRNGVLLELFEPPTEFYPIADAVGENRVASAVVVNCKVRDYNPSF